MTYYETDNLPEEIPGQEFPEELIPLAVDAVHEAIESQNIRVQEAKVVYAYDRKGWLTMDTVGGSRNPSYASDVDDMIIQLTVRIPHPLLRKGELETAAELEKSIKEHRQKEHREKLEADIAKADAKAKEAQAEADAKRAELANL